MGHGQKNTTLTADATNILIGRFEMSTLHRETLKFRQLFFREF